MEPLTPEQSELAATGIDKARQVANWYSTKRPTLRDDIESAAMLGVLRAAGSYDDKRVWETWVSTCVRWTIREQLEVGGRNMRRIEPFDPTTLRDFPSNSDSVGAFEEREHAEFMCGLIGPEGQKTIKPIFEEGLSHQQLAGREHVTRQAIDHRLQKAFDIIRKQTEREDAA